MDKPQTRFTRAGDVAIAYQVVGEGPVDLIYISGWLHNIDVVWEHPGYNRMLEQLTQKCRLILFDKRGTGMSDRDVGAPTLEERAEDIRAVMNAVGIEQASFFGISEGAAMTAMFAACYPERVQSIVLIGCRVCATRKPDWPFGQRREDQDQFLANLETHWGDLGYLLEWAAPDVKDDPEECAFFNRLLIQSASPSSALAITRLGYEADIRPILPAIEAPTLVLHPDQDFNIDVGEARYLADNIPNARFDFVKNSHHLPWIGDVEGIVKQITDFVCDPPAQRPESRVLATILMTDIDGSTAASAEMGDAKWREVIDAHDTIAARATARHDGTLIKTMGDGILATFAGPSRAVSCARDIQTAAADLGLSVRAGIHTGECLRRGNDVSGLAVTIAARILDTTPGGECRVSSALRDLVVGSGLEFAPAGTHALKGVPGDWDLFSVTG